MIIRRIKKPFGERLRKARTGAGRQLKGFTDIFIMWLSISGIIRVKTPTKVLLILKLSLLTSLWF